ncbi:hypothetical protein IL306_014187 [Fusarium sp. DS 682]|nr:hypothetical protein IL306_014187 [Fusarium sp. DS 682]
MKRYIFQRWIWEVVDGNFFSKKSKDIDWTSDYWKAQATMERYLQDHKFSFEKEVESLKFTNWRFTAMQFYASLEDSPRGIKRMVPDSVVSILTKALGPYIPEKPEESLRRDLDDLAKVVVEIEVYFDANWCFFSHVFRHPTNHQTCGFPYSPELEGVKGQAMKSVDEKDSDKGRSVEFVAAPMLQQRGNRYGSDYHVKKAIYPMEVYIAWLEDEEGDEEEEDDEEGDDEEGDDEEGDDEEGDDEGGEAEEEEEEEKTKEKAKEKEGHY